MLALKFALRNLRRNRRRSLIEISSIAGAVFLGITYNNLGQGSYADMIREGVRAGSGHIGFYQGQYLNERKSEQSFAASELLPMLQADPRVATATARLYVPSLVQSARGARPAALIGLDPATDRHPLLDAKFYVSGAPVSDTVAAATPVVAVGAVLAEKLGLGPGKKFVWMAQDAGGETVSRLLRVGGIFKTGMKELDSGTILAPRAWVGAWIGQPGAAHELAVLLHEPESMDAVWPELEQRAQAISPQLHAYRWPDAMPALHNAIRIDEAGIRMMVGFVYLLVAIGTINTMLMSVMERTREFGVVRALGLGRGAVMRIVMTEALVLGMLAASLGVALAAAATEYMRRIGINLANFFGEEGVDFGGVMIEPIMRAAWDVPMTVALALCMVLLAVLAAIYPAYVATRGAPADAMRRY